jgi:hypothetical protein
VAQARYHYVAAIPLVVLICLALQEIGGIGPLRRLPRGALAVTVLALGVWGSAAHVASGQPAGAAAAVSRRS